MNSTSMIPIFKNGDRTFIVDIDKHYQNRNNGFNAHLIDYDTKAKLSLPMHAMNGLYEFYQEYHSELILW